MLSHCHASHVYNRERDRQKDKESTKLGQLKEREGERSHVVLTWSMAHKSTFQSPFTTIILFPVIVTVRKLANKLAVDKAILLCAITWQKFIQGKGTVWKLYPPSLSKLVSNF